MIRNFSLEEISDGKVYSANDMVKADTGNCSGCHACCMGMGSSIILDPFDVWRIGYGTGMCFNDLLENGFIELNMVDGIILPNIRMGESDRCSFLDSNGRCRIHKLRPGICRLFPLGRVYNDDGFGYFLQSNQCPKKRAKIKVKKWIDAVNLCEYDKFIYDWHNFIKKSGEKIISLKKSGMGEKTSDIAMFVLNTFYVSDVTADLNIDINSYDDMDEAVAKNIYMQLRKMIVKAKNAIR